MDDSTARVPCVLLPRVNMSPSEYFSRTKQPLSPLAFARVRAACRRNMRSGKRVARNEGECSRLQLQQSSRPRPMESELTFYKELAEHRGDDASLQSTVQDTIHKLQSNSTSVDRPGVL